MDEPRLFCYIEKRGESQSPNKIVPVLRNSAFSEKAAKTINPVTISSS